MRIRTVLAAIAIIGLAACNDTAVMVPLNQQAQATGAPRLRYASGMPFGVLNVTMPDGESLPGEFRVDEMMSPDLTGANPDGSNFFASASGPRTRLACTGRMIAGHGQAECRSQTGAVYRLPL